MARVDGREIGRIRSRQTSKTTKITRRPLQPRQVLALHLQQASPCLMTPHRSRNFQVPWPGKTYIIIEKGTDRAITLTTAGLCLQDVKEDPGANNRRQCVYSENYISFYNPKARVYMGHDGGDSVRASAVALKRWELMVPRHHPDGGYQLLTPYWSATMMMITAEEDGARVMRTRHGTNLWQFVPV